MNQFLDSLFNFAWYKVYTIECNVTRKGARLLAFKVKITEARTNYSASSLLKSSCDILHSYLCGRWRVADARPPLINAVALSWRHARLRRTRLKSTDERIRITELLPTWAIVCALIGIHGVRSLASYQWHNTRCYYELSRYCLFSSVYPLLKRLNTFSGLLWIIWRTPMSFSQICSVPFAIINMLIGFWLSGILILIIIDSLYIFIYRIIKYLQTKFHIPTKGRIILWEN